MTLAELLSAVDTRSAGRVVLWRAADLEGRDVDVAALPGADDAIAETLTEAGFTFRGEPDGRVVWSRADDPEVDVWPARHWPGRYPPLERIAMRAERREGIPLPVASPGDRLLVLAADAVGGRPLEKLARKAESALGEPGGRASLEAVAHAEGAAALRALIEDPGALAARGSRGRMPYGAAAVVAARSAHARAALTERVRSRAAPARPAARSGLLVALSGMDGSGKSTAAEAARDRLEAAGRPARVEWARLGNEGEVLDRIAGPVKRLLGGRGSVADPVAAGGPLRELEAKAQEGRRRGPVAWVWTLFVALVNARAHRRASRGRRRGESVVCDRWLADSLVDLELRYGRHRAAAVLLRALVPRPDVAFLLAIDARTSIARKPGDQAGWVLERMEELYERAAERHGLMVVDATRPLDDVVAQVAAEIDAKAR